jgi:hypothetical protein
MFDTPKCTVFPASVASKHLVILFITSSLLSTVSFGLSTASLGNILPFIYPAAFGATAIHHISIYCLLPRTSPADTRFKSLRSTFNFGLFLFLALIWWVGGIMSLAIVAFNFSGSEYSGHFALDLASDCAAMVESGILIVIAVFCRQLGTKADLEHSKIIPTECDSVSVAIAVWS